MKRSVYSPISASMICSSRAVPRVATTSACVSPRVNSAEPWARGSTPVRIGDRTHGAGVAAVDARLAIEDLAADDLRFHVAEDVLDGAFVGRRRGALHEFVDDTRLQFVDAMRAGLLLLDPIGLAQIGFGDARDVRDSASSRAAGAQSQSGLPASDESR
jgi:hypothetical protein